MRKLMFIRCRKPRVEQGLFLDEDGGEMNLADLQRARHERWKFWPRGAAPGPRKCPHAGKSTGPNGQRRFPLVTPSCAPARKIARRQ